MKISKPSAKKIARLLARNESVTVEYRGLFGFRRAAAAVEVRGHRVKLAGRIMPIHQDRLTAATFDRLETPAEVMRDELREYCEDNFLPRLPLDELMIWEGLTDSNREFLADYYDRLLDLYASELHA